MRRWSKRAVWPGAPYPLGATWDGSGVNFALFSEHAEGVELCLFDPAGGRETERISVEWQTDLVWHCYLPQARPGWIYGYRVHGPYVPKRGQRFNGNKLLLDPYARDVAGHLAWDDRLFGYVIGHPDQDLQPDTRDSASGMLKGRIIDPAFAWGEDRPPRIPWHDTIIYELHVKGFTHLHPEVPSHLRGTYTALTTAPVIRYLKELGVTAVELMPVHAFVDDRHLVERGERNYWGYNSVGYFAPDGRYASGDPVRAFKAMVKCLHSHEIEVILDVVYNHTAEGNRLGPTLSFRGIDNQSYYRLDPDNPREFVDYTGCGNTLNMQHPKVLQLIMDSLRYWVQEMHVDGFRFDLASALARELHEVDRLGAFFDIIHQDPVLSRVKLIAEPWDLGEGGYQVGNFPVGWTEWNGRYRDAIRSYWKGEGGMIGELAYRLTGSSDLYEHSGRRPHASVNFVTCHDGFTLRDLVSFNHKHNEANGEQNRDGEDHNLSWNCGTEGDTGDPAINALRSRQQRNFLATLFLSQGVPMLLAGDERGRSQNGNNNAYCQDNALSWLRWDPDAVDRELLNFVRTLIRLRKVHPLFRRRHFFQGRRIRGLDVKDITWLDPRGEEMEQARWDREHAGCLGMLLSGGAIEEQDERGRRIRDDDLILLFNAESADQSFRLPEQVRGVRWEVLIDTVPKGEKQHVDSGYGAGDAYPLRQRSAVLLVARPRWSRRLGFFR